MHSPPEFLEVATPASAQVSVQSTLNGTRHPQQGAPYSPWTSFTVALRWTSGNICCWTVPLASRLEGRKSLQAGSFSGAGNACPVQIAQCTHSKGGTSSLPNANGVCLSMSQAIVLDHGVKCQRIGSPEPIKLGSAAL